MNNTLGTDIEGLLENCDIRLEFCERFDNKSSIWNFMRHKHEFHELLYFLNGSAKTDIEQDHVDVNMYDIVIYPKGMYHQEHIDPQVKNEVLCCWVDMPGVDIPGVIHVQDRGGEIKMLMDALHKEHKTENPSKLLMDSYIKSIFVLISRKAYLSKPPEEPVDRVIMYMQDHFKEYITVEDLAGLINVSQSYVARIFRKKVGTTLMEYLMLLRIEAAKKQLSTTNKTVEDIAFEVGYNCPKYFCRTFKKVTGMSPREYKKSISS